MKTEETFVHREQSRKWTLPKLLSDGNGRLSGKMRTYKVLGYRYPNKNEYYLSGAICEAYIAPNDFTDKYLVIKFAEVEFVQKTIWIQKTD
jgi:hypothetical protein